MILLLGVAVASTFWILLDVAGAYRTTSFGVESFENRFGALQNLVTAKSVYGYASDNRPEDPSDQAEFYLTQYTLAPAIITTSTTQREVIANMHAGKPDVDNLRARHLEPVRDFGNGIYLCRNVSAR